MEISRDDDDDMIEPVSVSPRKRENPSSISSIKLVFLCIPSIGKKRNTLPTYFPCLLLSPCQQQEEKNGDDHDGTDNSLFSQTSPKPINQLSLPPSSSLLPLKRLPLPPALQVGSDHSPFSFVL
jgi:hypothetical protein